MGVTTYFLFKGIRAVSGGQSLSLARALQGRVMGQFGTLSVIMATGAYLVMNSPVQVKNHAAEEERIAAQGEGSSRYRGG